MTQAAKAAMAFVTEANNASSERGDGKKLQDAVSAIPDSVARLRRVSARAQQVKQELMRGSFPTLVADASGGK